MSCAGWPIEENATTPYYDTDPLPFDGFFSLTPKYKGVIGWGFLHDIESSGQWTYKYMSMYLINSLVGTPFIDFGYFDENFIDENGPFKIKNY